MQSLTLLRRSWLPVLLLASIAISGCSKASTPASAAAEQKAFVGDRSQMPQSEQVRIQQRQQQAAGRMQAAPSQAQQGHR